MANRKIANICDKLILGCLVLLAVLIPLAQTSSTYAVNEPIKVMLLRILTVLIAALWVVRAVESGGISLRRTSLDLPLLAFLSVNAIATLASVDPRLSLWGQLYRYEGLATVVNYVFIYYAAVHFVKGERERNLLLGATLAVAGVVAIYAVLQRFGIDYIIWDPEMMDVSRSIATFGNAVFLGAYLTLMLPIAIVYVFFPGQSRGRARSTQHIGRASSATTEDENEKLDTQRSEFGTENQESGTRLPTPAGVANGGQARYQAQVIIRLLLRIALILLVPLLIAALIFSYTRAAWIGSLGAVFFIALFSFGRIWRRKKLVLLIIALLVAAIVVLGFVVSAGSVGTQRSLAERIRSIFRPSEGSVSSRLVLWDTSLQMIRARPVLGFGPDTLALAFQQYQPANWYKAIKESALPDKTHNEMLQVAATTGFLGLTVYLWLLITFLVVGFGALRRGHPHRSLLIGLLAAVLGYLIQIQLSFSIISVAPMFWLVLGIAVSVIDDEKSESVTVMSEKGVPLALRAVLYPSLVILVILFSLSAVRPFLADQQVRKAWASLAFNFWDDAAHELEVAVKLNPGEPRYLIRLGEAYLAKYRGTHDSSSRQKAFSVLEKARKMSPRSENVYFYLGGLYVEMGKTSGPRYFDKAAASYRKVLELSPNDVDAHFDLGIAYANRDKHDLAIKEWRRVIALDPKFLPAYLVLGRAYELRNNSRDAKKMYNKVLEIDSNNPYAERALEGLNKK